MKKVFISSVFWIRSLETPGLLFLILVLSSQLQSWWVCVCTLGRMICGLQTGECVVKPEPAALCNLFILLSALESDPGASMGRLRPTAPTPSVSGTLGSSASRVSAVSHRSALELALPSVQKLVLSTSSFLCVTDLSVQPWPKCWLVREALGGHRC